MVYTCTGIDAYGYMMCVVYINIPMEGELLAWHFLHCTSQSLPCSRFEGCVRPKPTGCKDTTMLIRGVLYRSIHGGSIGWLPVMHLRLVSSGLLSPVPGRPAPGPIEVNENGPHHRIWTRSLVQLQLTPSITLTHGFFGILCGAAMISGSCSGIPSCGQ